MRSARRHVRSSSSERKSAGSERVDEKGKEKVMALQDRKRELVAGVIGGEGVGGAISATDIRALLD